MTDINPRNSVPASARAPEIITEEGGGQRVRLALETETGTIVFVDLLPAEADALSGRLGRLGYQAKEHNAKVRAARKPPPGGPHAEKLLAVMRSRGGEWYPYRLSRSAETLGIKLSPDEAGRLLHELSELGSLRRVRDSTFVPVQ